jgi:hypothetical protein
MTILAWPSDLRRPSSATFGLQANTQSGGKSPFDGTEQTLELPGARWAAQLAWQNLPEAQWRILQAFLAALGGRAGRFTWGPPNMPRRASAGSGGAPGPRVRVGGQTGRVLSTTGWAAGGAAMLRGDILQWLDPAGRPQLHMVTADVAASAGTVDLPIAPAIRKSPAADTGLTLGNPVGVFRLAEDLMPLEFGGPVFASLQLKIEEALF